jgi:hypothetical protein
MVAVVGSKLPSPFLTNTTAQEDHKKTVCKLFFICSGSFLLFCNALAFRRTVNLADHFLINVGHSIHINPKEDLMNEVKDTYLPEKVNRIIARQKEGETIIVSHNVGSGLMAR